MQYVKTSTKGMSREDWLNERRTGIGGSDAGAILGLSKWASPFSVYADKIGMIPDREETEAMRLGTDMEDYVARRFMDATGKRVRRSNYMYRSTKHPFMLADVDRMVIGENSGLECKTMSTFAANSCDLEAGDIPPQYYCQCMHYMAVLGADRWYLGVLVLQRGFYWFTIDRDDGEIAELIRQEEAFWTEHVEPRIPPAPDGSQAASEVIRDMFGGSRDEVETTALAGKTEEVREYLELQKRIKALTTAADAIKQDLQISMGDATVAYAGNNRVTWKAIESRRLDSKRLRADKPEIFDEYAKTSVSRRFEIKHLEEETA